MYLNFGNYRAIEQALVESGEVTIEKIIHDFA